MVVSFDIIITINIVIVGRRSGRSFYFRECGKRETWLVDNEILRIDSITLEYVNVKMGMKFITHHTMPVLVNYMELADSVRTTVFFIGGSTVCNCSILPRM